ncbi:FtsK/SpoIIIE domain-containing protein [Flexivirga caeni]|uniref:FtsK/SpoIIIE domain-containing protein n=1 Tax=Flexivirga caeni TaxID=2294115 RepID=UPI0013155EA2|nr:FtsK/SpoIIIE domain-containing protein [Flexivirga caeni]
MIGSGLAKSARCWRRCYLLALLLGIAAGVGAIAGLTWSWWALAGVLVGAGFPGAVWQARWPASYERRVVWPALRRGWRKRVQLVWPEVCREAGLSSQRTVKARDGAGSVQVWTPPALREVSASGVWVDVIAQVRMGQTPDELIAAAPRFAAAMNAQSVATEQLAPSVVQLRLVMCEPLRVPVTAAVPQHVELDRITLGRQVDGSPWSMQLIERHTLVVGASGSGKGSVLWGICGGLAPAARADLVRLYGVDLKGGVEIGMGEGLFTTTAETVDEALVVLRTLVEVMDKRLARMRGVERLHRPAPGEPLHVLVIDELAALVAYSTEREKVAEATKLLARLLSAGRAPGILVLAFVQDPTKKTVEMRGLFTQTVALRLRSAEEVRMVLGDGMTDVAPAHKISPATPGMGYVVQENGTAVRVRADYWPDGLVQRIGHDFPAPVKQPVVHVAPAPGNADNGDSGPARSPRKPRSPRASRGLRSDAATRSDDSEAS